MAALPIPYPPTPGEVVHDPPPRIPDYATADRLELEASFDFGRRGVRRYRRLAGFALIAIHDRKLWREAGFATFGAYCLHRWNMKGSHPYSFMGAANPRFKAAHRPARPSTPETGAQDSQFVRSDLGALEPRSLKVGELAVPPGVLHRDWRALVLALRELARDAFTDGLDHTPQQWAIDGGMPDRCRLFALIERFLLDAGPIADRLYPPVDVPA